MKILNLGSINIDHTYSVNHFVRPGETIASNKYDTSAGGKGFNQSVALARAGVKTWHAGKIGINTEWLLKRLESEGVNVINVVEVQTPTGHAVIQVIPSGENSIVLYGGANQTISKSDISLFLKSTSPGDYLLLQNETSSVDEAIRKGKEHKLQIIFNPAPFTPAIHNYPLHDVDIFILNETEAEGLTGKILAEDIHEFMRKQFPRSATVLTRGQQGAVYFNSKIMLEQSAITVDAIDCTAAGDTFIGYFLAELIESNDPAKALSAGCQAAAICVTREGSSDSIPFRKELQN